MTYSMSVKNTLMSNMPEMATFTSRLRTSLLFGAMALFCASQLYLELDSKVSAALKLCAFLLILITVLTRPTFNKAVFLLLPLSCIFLVNILLSHSIPAAVDELARYFFPIIIIISLYSSSDIVKDLARLFIFIVISNDIYQIYAYFAFYSGMPLLAPMRFELGYIVRAGGWMNSFVAFGFMNFCAFLLVRHGDIFNSKKVLLEYVFLLFALLSTSLKAVVAIIIYFLFVFKTKKGFQQLFSVALACVIILLAFKPDIVFTLYKTAGVKTAVYFTEGNSARSDSYRVMFESLMSGNLIGEGLGTFGGPASTQYLSPLYEKYNFNWYALGGKLNTTDTYYPHLFVELGLIGGLLYLYFIFFYGQKNRTKMWWVVVLAFAADNVTSFSIAAPPNYFAAALTMLVFSCNTVRDKHTGLDKKHNRFVHSA